LTDRGSREPIRTCVACGRKASQKDLLRFALSGDRAFWDLDRRMPGRGAYICPRQECLEALKRDRKKGRIFRRQLGEEAWAELTSIPKD
jgi:predicted RNA-binding protein YlxR (DUF448 family)